METKENIFLTKSRYLLALSRFRERVEKGLKLVLDDSNVPGQKHTHASWGLCAVDAGREPQIPAAWPDAEDHLFPDDLERFGRQSPKYRTGETPCPFDDQERDLSNARTGIGCFYRCKLFNPRPGQKPPSREEAVELYKIRLKEAAR